MTVTTPVCGKPAASKRSPTRTRPSERALTNEQEAKKLEKKEEVEGEVG